MGSGPGKSDGQSRSEKPSVGPGAPGNDFFAPQARTTNSFIVAPEFSPSTPASCRRGRTTCPQRPTGFHHRRRPDPPPSPQRTHWSCSGRPAKRAETRTRRRPCGPKLNSNGSGKAAPIDAPPAKYNRQNTKSPSPVRGRAFVDSTRHMRESGAPARPRHHCPSSITEQAKGWHSSYGEFRRWAPLSCRESGPRFL